MIKNDVISTQRDRIILYLGTLFNTIYYTSEFRFRGVFMCNNSIDLMKYYPIFTEMYA